MKVYRVVPRDPDPNPGASESSPTVGNLTGETALESSDYSAGETALESSDYSLRVDNGTGRIRSLIHRGHGQEMVSEGEGGLNQYLYVPGRDPKRVVTSGAATVRWKEAGPLVRSLEITAPAPGLREPLVMEIRLVEGLDRVDIVNTITKEWVLDPEAVLFRLPFSVENPEVWIDAPFGPFRPEVDQLPGASKNYFSVQRWVDLSGPEAGVTVTSVDAPLIQFGEIRTDAIVTGWLDEFQASPILFSYVMNNYWETNYRAAQDDEVTFRYSLQLHGAFEKAGAERFGLEHARPLIGRVIQR